MILQKDDGKREKSALFPPREALTIMEVMKAIIAINPEIYKNVGKPDFTASEFLKRIRNGIPKTAMTPSIENIDRADIEEVPIEDAEEVVETQSV